MLSTATVSDPALVLVLVLFAEVVAGTVAVVVAERALFAEPGPVGPDEHAELVDSHVADAVLHLYSTADPGRLRFEELRPAWIDVGLILN